MRHIKRIEMIKHIFLVNNIHVMICNVLNYPSLNPPTDSRIDETQKSTRGVMERLSHMVFGKVLSDTIRFTDEKL